MQKNELAMMQKKQLAHGILQCMGGSIPVDKIMNSLCHVFEQKSIENRKMIVGVFQAVSPELEKMGEKFFDLLVESLYISNSLNIKEYDMIANVVVNDTELTTEQKMEMISKEMDRIAERKNKRIMTWVGSGAVTAVGVTIAKGLDRLFKAKEKTMLIDAKIRKRKVLLDFVEKIIHFWK